MSHLSTLDDLLAAIEEGDASALTTGQLRARLISRRLWWHAVSDAVTAAPHRLVDWERGADPLVAGVLDDHDLLATRNIAAVGVLLAAARGDLPRSAGVEAITAAARRWGETGLLVEDTGGPHGWRDDTGALALVDPLHDGPARSLAHIAAGLASGTVSPPVYQHEVRVLFDTGERRGTTGSLKVAVLPGGPPGLFPDPRSMTFLEVDEQFTASLGAAWTCATRKRKRPPCVLWSVDVSDRRLVLIKGPSLGAAFAVALRTALHRLRRLDPFLWRWREKCAVTGAVSPSGEIGSVDGLEGKLEAAGVALWNVVAPHANRDVSGTPLVAGVDVRWVRNVRQAHCRTRRLRWKWPVAALGAVLLVFASLVIYTQMSGRDEDRAAAQRQEAVATLLNEVAKQSGTQRTRALRYSLAALALEDSDRVKAAMTAALTTRREPVILFTGRGEITATAFAGTGHALIAGVMGATTWEMPTLSAVQEIGELKVDTGSPAGVSVAAVNADGTLAVVARAGAGARLWNLSDKAVPALVGGLGECELVSASFDTRRLLLTGCADGTVTLWETVVGAPPKALGDLRPGPGDLRSVALYKGGFAVATPGGVRFWSFDESSEQPRFTPVRDLEAARGDALVLTAGAAGLVAGHTDGARVWAAGSGNLGVPTLAGKPARLSFADGAAITAVATGGGENPVILTGDARGQAVLWVRGRGGYRPAMLLDGHTDAITSVGLSLDGAKALTGSRDGTVRLWDVHNDGPYELDGSAPLGAQVEKVVTSPKNSVGLAITGTGEAVLWDLADPSQPNRLTGIKSHRGSVRAAAFDPAHGTRLASGSEDGEVVLSDISAPTAPTELARMPTSGPVAALAFDPSGSKIAAGTGDGTVVVAEVGARKPTWAELPRDEKHPVRALAYGRDADLLAVGDATGQVELWQGSTRVGRIDPGEHGGVRALAFNPRGRTLLVASETSNAVRQYEVSESGEAAERTALPAGTGKVRSIAYSFDGRLAVGADTRGTALVWSLLDPGAPHLLAELTGHTGAVLSVATSGGGATVVSGSADETVNVWDISELLTINDNPRDRACREAQRAMTAEEWRSDERLRHFDPIDNCAGR
ncbi:hypothetical protein [Lentzea sp. NPDC092896]|uniref:hypothetical protein n=1 Tax=Lentzea sp. NPDC092896 TaxID=3364127 RepID=UPI003812A302